MRSRRRQESFVAAEDGQYAAELGAEKLEMPLAKTSSGVRLHEPFARILADSLEQPVAAFAGEVAVRHQKRLVNESRR
jgi:hypothetical protein